MMSTNIFFPLHIHLIAKKSNLRLCAENFKKTKPLLKVEEQDSENSRNI